MSAVNPDSRQFQVFRTSVVIVEDHPLYRYALEQTFSRGSDIDLIGSCACASEALERIGELNPDVALVDLHLGDGDGLLVLDAVRRNELRTRTLVLSADHEPASISAALAAGAIGYLSKDVDANALIDAVRAAAGGRTVFTADLHGAVAVAIRGRDAAAESPLTRREHDVMYLSAAGNSVAEMATQLHVSCTTVKTHLANAYRKLGACDRASAVAQAIKQGFITVD